MDLILQQTVNAFALGGTYALLALGLAVVFSVMGLINFAHGELMTSAGYVLMYCGLAGLPFALSASLAVVAAILIAVAMERIAFRPVRNASGATMLVTSFAVAMILQVLFQNLISVRSQPVLLPDVLSDSIRVFGLVIGINKIAAIVATLVMLVFLDWFMTKRKTGIAMRAAAEDFAIARLMGIRANTVIAGAFALSGLLAGVAAVLWVSQRASVDPLMGFTPVLKAFIAAILGGLGSLRGAVAGGFVLGFVEVFLAAFLPQAFPRIPRSDRPWTGYPDPVVPPQRPDPGADIEGGKSMMLDTGSDTGRLLTNDDPAPFEIVNGDSDHPVVLICEHAGRNIPRKLGALGLDAEHFDLHIAYDIGSGSVARAMAEKMGAPLILQPFSRLVVDCNRPTSADDAIPSRVDGVAIPGNAGIVEYERKQRISEIFEPFHDAVSAVLDRTPRRAAIAIHSFTPQLAGQFRPWDIAFLFRKDTATSKRLADAIRVTRPGLFIGMNEPYAIEDSADWFVPYHGERRGLAHSLIEIRNDHLRSDDDCANWATMLAEAIDYFLQGAEQ